MNDPTQPMFFNELQWSGNPSAIEEWSFSDGAVAVAIGCASVLTCGLAAIAISLGYLLGRAT